jgi:hypothetical protein
MDQFGKVMQIIQKAKEFGYRKLPNGAQLFGRVPHVAPEAWLHAVFAPLSSAGISDVEKQLAIDLSPSLRDFLANANGLTLFSTSLSLYGLRTDFSRQGDSSWQPFDIITPNTLERPRGAKPSFIFIGSYDWDGSLLYVDSRYEKVYRCANVSPKPLNEWPGFWEMLTAESARLATHFDGTGHELDLARPTIPCQAPGTVC